MRVSNLLFLRARTGTTQQEHVQYSSTLSARLIRVGTSRLLHRPARRAARGHRHRSSGGSCAAPALPQGVIVCKPHNKVKTQTATSGFC
jgi:hypothetical protein